MKTIVKITNLLFASLFIFILSLSFQSCSKDVDYKKACAEQDWAKAYEIVDRIKEDKALEYVVFQESISVIEEYGENGLIRIAGIIKEHDADWLYAQLYKTMASIGNDELKEKIVKMAEGAGVITKSGEQYWWPVSFEGYYGGAELIGMEPVPDYPKDNDEKK